MLLLNALHAPGKEELLKALVLEAPDHASTVARYVTRYKSYNALAQPSRRAAGPKGI